MNEDQNKTQMPQTVVNTPSATTDSFAKPQGPRVVDPSKKKKSKWPSIIIIFIIFVVVAVALYLLSSPNDNDELATPSPFVNSYTSSPEPVLGSTPEPVERSEIEILILNGTGIAGEAGFLQGKLAGLDYEEVEVDNASNTDHETTEVTFADDLSEAIVDEIVELLEEVYEDVEIDTAKASGSDITITTGLRKGQTPAPDETETPEPTETGSPSPSPATPD